MVAFSSGIHSSGRYQGLPVYEDYFPNLMKGARTSLRASVILQFPGGAICRSEVFKREFRLMGTIPTHSGVLTLLNVVYHFDHRGSVISTDEDSWILPIRQATSHTILELIETCTGLGALGLGAEFAGWTVVARNEIQPKMAEVLRTNMKGSIVDGSIEHLHVVAGLHAAGAGSTSFAFGFSCQPFSRAGDRRGGQDVRSMTLPWGLWTSYMLSCPLTILECVSDAPKFPFVKLALQQFEEITRHVKSEVVLDLNSLLPARRERWWCVFSAPWIGRVTLPELPSLSSRPTVCDFFESIPVPSSIVLDQMTLKDHEIRGMSQGQVLVEQAVVNLLEPLPTALHSWSNQFHACPCECRGGSLSTDRIIQKGFYGVLVSYADETDRICYRHLSPQEVGLMNGLPLVLGEHPNSRLEMAAVGQMASPVQSAWIFSAIRRHLGDLGICHLPRVQIRDPLEAICRELFRIRQELWPQLNISVAMKLYAQHLMSLLGGHGESFHGHHLLEGESKHEPKATIPQVSISPTLAWPTIPGALPGFSLGSPPADIPIADVQQEPHEIDRSRSPRKQVFPMQVESREIQSSVESVVHPPRVSPVMPPPEMHTTASVESHEVSQASPLLHAEEVTGSSQKAWNYIRAPPAVLDSAQESGIDPVEATVAVQRAFHHAGVGLSPDELLDGRIVLVDFRSQQFSTFAASDTSTVQDLLLAEEALGNPSCQCRDAFGDSLSHGAILRQQPVVLLSPQDSVDKFPPTEGLTRILSVHTQGAAVANDEMDFYLGSIQKCLKIGITASLLVPCLEDVHIATAAWFSEIQCLVFHKPVASTILLGNHWIPVFVERRNSQIVVHTTLEGVDAWQTLGMDPNLLSTTRASPLPKAFDKDCGFQAFAWLVSMTYGEVEPTLFTPAFAKNWRMLFWIHLLMQPSKAHVISSFAVGGHNPRLQTAVATILREHGVPIEQAATRASEVISSLGTDRITTCLKEPRPWASLKQLANSQQPPMRLILPKELQKMVEARGLKKQQVGVKSNKVGDAPKSSKCIIQPSDVIIPAGVFAQNDGTPIGQIPSSQVGSNSRGIVVLSEIEFSPFAPQALISTEGLAFAVIEPSQVFIEQYGGLTRFPARCAANGEPMLITAAIVQKGQKAIHRATPPQLPSVPEVPVVTVKLMLYRDQCTVPWTSVLDGPVKHLLQLAPCLSVCRVPDFQCPAKHVSTQDSAEPILDLWNRDFVTMQFRKTAAKDADIFACHLRILASSFDALTAVSGIAGLFVEPREADGRGHCTKHHTVWMPKVTHSEIMRMKQQAKAPVFVVRVAQRYGFKTSVEKADVIHEQFRHDTPFLAGLTTTYVVGPLPWGCTRQSLQKLIASWNWPAKAIQPAGRSADGLGILWHAQAAQAPQHPVITMSHGDVLIVAKETQSSKPPVVAIEASSHTKECLTATSKEVKPLKGDPWAAAAAHLPGRHPPGLTPIQAQQLEERIDQKLALIEGDAPMQESLEPRVIKPWKIRLLVSMNPRLSRLLLLKICRHRFNRSSNKLSSRVRSFVITSTINLPIR